MKEQDFKLPPIYENRNGVIDEEEEDEKQIENSKSIEHVESQDQSTPQREGGQSEDNIEQEKDQEYYRKALEKKQKEEMEHMSKDNWFTKLLVNKTWLVLTLSVIFI